MRVVIEFTKMNILSSNAIIPSQDEIVMSIGGIPDEKGHLLDIHETLYYSPSKRFYLHRVITEIWDEKQAMWKTARLDDNHDRCSLEQKRLVKQTDVMTDDEVIRYIVDIYMPDVAGVKRRTHLALNLGGISTARSCL